MWPSPNAGKSLKNPLTIDSKVLMPILLLSSPENELFSRPPKKVKWPQCHSALDLWSLWVVGKASHYDPDRHLFPYEPFLADLGGWANENRWIKTDAERVCGDQNEQCKTDAGRKFYCPRIGSRLSYRVPACSPIVCQVPVDKAECMWCLVYMLCQLLGQEGSRTFMMRSEM